MSILAPHFHKIASDLPGAEGPVFSKSGDFFMVAATRHDTCGDIAMVHLQNGKVCHTVMLK